MAFAEIAKPLKEKSKLTLQQIADRCGVSESMVSRYLNGTNIPPEDVARRILEVLNAAVAERKVETTGDDDMKDALATIRNIYENHIADLKDRLKHERIEKWIFVGLLAIVITFVFALFYVDITNGNVGWFRH